MRRKVLCFLYYFPPSGGPGVLRGLKFVKYLRDFGFEPVVVTVRAETFSNPGEYPPDPSALAEVPEGVYVHRVPSREPVRLKRLLVRAKLMRAAQFLLYPLFWERQAMWIFPALRAARRILARERVHVIYTCSGPYCSNLIGLALAPSGIPWVADHRDPFTQGWHFRWPSRAHHRACERLEARVLERAARFVANTPTQRRELLAAFPFVPAGRVRTIPNGYDEADFGTEQRPRPPDGTFRIVHAGSFSLLEPGGGGASTLRSILKDRLEYRNRWFDASTLSPAGLFEALAVIRRDRPEVYRTLRFDMVGHVSPRWRAEADRLGVGDAVRRLGPRPHAEAVRHMMDADLLFLPTDSRRDGRRMSRVSQKAYEYMRAGPPVLAVTDESDVGDLVARSGAGWTVPQGDVPALASAVLRAREGGAAPRRDEAFVERFERRHLTGRLAETLAEAIRERRR